MQTELFLTSAARLYTHPGGEYSTQRNVWAPLFILASNSPSIQGKLYGVLLYHEQHGLVTLQILYNTSSGQVNVNDAPPVAGLPLTHHTTTPRGFER